MRARPRRPASSSRVALARDRPAGTIAFEGRPITRLRPHRIVALGIARTFQNIRLFQDLSAVENVLAGRHCRTRAGVLAALLRPPGQVREEREAVARAAAELDFVGLSARATDLARNLAYGDQRRLEIARALATDPRLRLNQPSPAGPSLALPAPGFPSPGLTQRDIIYRSPRPRHPATSPRRAA